MKYLDYLLQSETFTPKSLWFGSKGCYLWLIDHIRDTWLKMADVQAGLIKKNNNNMPVLQFKDIFL